MKVWTPYLTPEQIASLVCVPRDSADWRLIRDAIKAERAERETLQRQRENLALQVEILKGEIKTELMRTFKRLLRGEP